MSEVVRPDEASSSVSKSSLKLPKLKQVLSGHSGWIWDVQFDPENDWFATASADNTIKIWSLAESKLKITLTNHRLGVRTLAISAQMPYLFSGGEDQQLLCWDLEHNQPVRQYHGHRSGIYTTALHPEIPYLLASGSRDSSIRLWDVRTRLPIRVLTHDAPINKISMQSDEPQLLSASQDRTVKMWDITSGKCRQTLTQHANSVRALAIHPIEYTFVTAARDGIRQWKMPEGTCLGEFTACKDDGATTLTCGDNYELYAGYESGLKTFDYQTGELVSERKTKSPVLCSALDHSGTRLITGHMDKTANVWHIM